MVHHAQRRVAAALGVRDHAHRQQVVHLLQAALLPQNFAVQRIEALHARFEFRRDAAFDELGANGVLHFFQKSLVDGAFSVTSFCRAK